MNAIRKYVVGFAALASVSAGAMVFAGNSGSPAVGTPAVSRLAENEEGYIPKLREARRMLNEAKGILEKEDQDHANYRQEAFSGIDKALDGIDREINELKKKH